MSGRIPQDIAWAEGPYDTEAEAMAAAGEYAADFMLAYVEKIDAEQRDDGKWDAVVFFRESPAAETGPVVVIEEAGFPWWILLAFLPFL